MVGQPAQRRRGEIARDAAGVEQLRMPRRPVGADDADQFDACKKAGRVRKVRRRPAEEAVAIANDSDYGLYGYVWSGDSSRGMRVARLLRTGTVQINGSPMNPDAPFGGYKMSGIGRDGGRYALHTYTELKYIGWTA